MKLMYVCLLRSNLYPAYALSPQVYANPPPPCALNLFLKNLIKPANLVDFYYSNKVVLVFYVKMCLDLES